MEIHNKQNTRKENGMNRLAMVCAVALAVAFAAEGKEPKRYLAPDGVNEIIDYGNGVRATTLLHVVAPEDVGEFPKCEVLTNAPCKVKGRNVITKKVRSPLGKEIDATKGMVGNLMLYTKEAFEEQHAMLTNAISRLEALERKEAEREKAMSDKAARRKELSERFKSAALERKAREESDKRKVMQDAVKRSKRCGSRNGRKGIITKEDVNKAASEGGAK